MSRPRRRFDWLWIGAPAAALGALFLALGRGAGMPHEGGAVLYPAVLLYNYGAIQLAIVILLAAALLLMLWLPQALRRLPRYVRNGAAMGLALAGAALACWGSLPRALGVEQYVHLDRALFEGRVYQLGARLGLDDDNYYVVCTCDQLGLLCRCRPVRPAGPPVFAERPVLAPAAGGGLAIRVGEQTVWTGDP